MRTVQKKLLFLINPHAGHSEIRSCLLDVLQIFSDADYAVCVYTSKCPKDLTKKIVSCGADYDLIVCTGGDGTFNEAISGLMQLSKRPPLGYLPTGTTNDVASTLGLSRNPVQAARDVVQGEQFEMDVGLFGKDRCFGYVAAFGLFTDVPYETPQEDKKALGRLAYLLSGAKALTEAKPVHVRVTANGKTEELDVLDGLVCSTLSVAGFKVGGDLGISLNDGKVELVLIRDLKTVLDFNAAASSLLRRDFRSESFLTAQTESVHFEFDEPVSWTVDGEFGGLHRCVDIGVARKAITVMIPKQSAEELP